jgi:hypothetical protein
MELGGREVFLRSKEVAPQRIRKFEVGSVCAWLADDGGSARDNIPGNNHAISKAVTSQAGRAEAGVSYPVERISFVIATNVQQYNALDVSSYFLGM